MSETFPVMGMPGWHLVHTVELAPGEDELPPGVSITVSEDGQTVTVNGTLPPGFTRDIVVTGTTTSSGHYHSFKREGSDPENLAWDERGLPMVPYGANSASIAGRAFSIPIAPSPVTLEMVVSGNGPRTITVRTNGHRVQIKTGGHEFSAIGRNLNGKLGLGYDNTTFLQPIRNHFYRGLVFDSISCGSGHSAGIIGGCLFTWGNNSVGELGKGLPLSPLPPSEEIHVPHLIAGMDDGNVTYVRCGTNNTIVIKKDGSAFAAGRTSAFFGSVVYEFTRFDVHDTITGQLVRWKDIDVTTNRHGLGIDTDGRVWSWGKNTSFCTGQGVDIGETYPPRLVAVNGSGNAPLDPPITGALKVFVHSITNNSMVLLSDGTLLTWGSGNSGAIGHGEGVAMTVPTSVGTGYTQVSELYDLHVLALKGTKLYRWGTNNHGETFTGSLVAETIFSPTQFGDDDYKSVYVSRYSSYALRVDDTLMVAGENDYNRLTTEPVVKLHVLTETMTDMFGQTVMSVSPSRDFCFFQLRTPASFVGSITQTEEDMDPLLTSTSFETPTHVIVTLGLDGPGVARVWINGQEAIVPTAEPVAPGEDGITLEGGEILWSACDWGDDGEAQALYENALVRRASIVGGGIPPPPVTSVTMRLEIPSTTSSEEPGSSDPEPVVVVTSPSITFPPVDQPVQPPAEEPSTKEWYEGVVFIVLVSIASFILVVGGSVLAWRRAHRQPVKPVKPVEPFEQV